MAVGLDDHGVQLGRWLMDDQEQPSNIDLGLVLRCTLAIRAVSFDQSGERLAVAAEYIVSRGVAIDSSLHPLQLLPFSSDMTLKILSVEDTSVVQQLKGHKSSIVALGWHPKGTFLVSTTRGSLLCVSSF